MENNKENEATNTEFNETKQLVEAVLERLTFHAFEDVFIWSNENASRALNRCLKKTLEEFENGELVLTSSYPKLKHFSVDNVVKGLMTTIDQAQERQDNLNKEIEELTSQLAKSQATPEGFVLEPEKGRFVQYELIDLLTRSLNSSKVLKTNTNWVHVVRMLNVGSTVAHRVCEKLGVDPESTKFEAQEQSHD